MLTRFYGSSAMCDPVRSAAYGTNKVCRHKRCLSIVKRRQLTCDGYANINFIPSVTAAETAAAAAVVSVEVPQ